MIDDWVVAERRHGTLAGYKTDGCRCDGCRRANAQHVEDQRAAPNPSPRRHGRTPEPEVPLCATARDIGVLHAIAVERMRR